MSLDLEIVERDQVKFLIENPHEIPISLVNRLVRLKITDWCNKGAEGQLEAREYFDKNPEEAWLMHFALTQYATIFGKSLRDAKIVSDSIRDVKVRLAAAKKKGLFRRCAETLFTDNERQTALIKRFEELDDELELLERQKTESLAQLIENQEKSKAIISEATIERDRVLTERAALRRQTEIQNEQLVCDAKKRIEEERALVYREINLLEDRKRSLEAEIREKQIIAEELSQDPLVLGEWERQG